MTTGEKIKMYRKQAGMTQKELAEKSGYSAHTMIVRIERDMVNIPLSKLNAIARALGVTLADILGDEEDKKPPVQVELDERDLNLINWFRSLPPETQKAIQVLSDAPQDIF